MHKRCESGIQERSGASETVTNVAQDETDPPVSSNIITTSLQSLNDKQNSHNVPSKDNKDFYMAMKLFPEFHLQDTHKKDWNRPLRVTTKRTINTIRSPSDAVTGSLSNGDVDRKIAEHLKNSKGIVDWVKNEYGM